MKTNNPDERNEFDVLGELVTNLRNIKPDNNPDEAVQEIIKTPVMYDAGSNNLLDANGRTVADIDSVNRTGEYVAKCINDHETLTAQVAELKGENHGVDNSTVLKLIRFAVTGDMVGFARYARFAAEKSTSEIFRNAVDKYLRGEFGSEVIPMQGGPNE
jgi:hypothetical protein